jgi:hypothetical protein
MKKFQVQDDALRIYKSPYVNSICLHIHTHARALKIARVSEREREKQNHADRLPREYISVIHYDRIKVQRAPTNCIKQTCDFFPVCDSRGRME